MANAAKAVNLVPSFGINDPMDSGTANVVLPGLLAKQSRIGGTYLIHPLVFLVRPRSYKLPRAPLSSQEPIFAICFIVIRSLISAKNILKDLLIGSAMLLRSARTNLRGLMRQTLP